MYVNNYCASMFHLFLKSNGEKINLFDTYSCFLDKYIEHGNKDSGHTWALNILENLLSYSLEMILLRYSKHNISFSDSKKHIHEWLNIHILPFLETFTSKGICQKKSFRTVLLEKIYKERVNFERKGTPYQYTVNSILLCDFFLSYFNGEEDNISRSNVYALLSDMVFFNPEITTENMDILIVKSKGYLEKSLKEYPKNSFAIKRINQLNENLAISGQLHHFEHDISSKISTLHSCSERLKKLESSNKTVNTIWSIVQDMRTILDFSKGYAANPEDVDMKLCFNESALEFDSKLDVKVICETKETTWNYFNKGYCKLLMENLLRNAMEAYERKKLTKPTPAVLLTLKNDCFSVQDWAGGIREDLFENLRLFDPYTSEKGVAQRNGLGLNMVKQIFKK